MQRRLGLLPLAISLLLGQSTAPPVWKEFSINSAKKPGKGPMEKTVEWTYPQTGSQVVYLACCPWLDIDGEGSISRDVWSLHSDGITIKSLLSRIDKLPQFQIIGPDWLATERYALNATVSDEYRLQLRRRSSRDPKDEVRALVEQELVQRFHLAMHRETKEVSVYVLLPIAGMPHRFRPLDRSRNPEKRGRKLQIDTHEGSIDTSSVGVNIFTTWLQNTLKHPVIDESAVPAGFAASFRFSWKDGGEPALLAAVKDQLGLELAQGQRSLEFLVLDHAERPALAGRGNAARK